MSQERRYNEAEIARIFEAATEVPPTGGARHPAPAEGMTLAQLQEIGHEVGIAADLVSQAAEALDRPVPVATAGRSLLGMPLGVGRTVELGRRLTDEEWERVVVDLRETFDARGTVRQEGSLRQWTNGNLHVLLEPGDRGHRLRLRTVNAQARSFIGAGTMALAGSAVLGTVLALSGRLASGGIGGPLFLALAGLAAIAWGALRLPAWARLRATQMEAIAARTQSRITTDG